METRVRYCTAIFSLDRIRQPFSIWVWDIDTYLQHIQLQEKQYGLHLIDEVPKVHIIIEYDNIIWNYKILFSSCKKKYKPLSKEDERWLFIEKNLFEDLKLIGIEEKTKEIIEHLKEEKYYEYKERIQIQFKKYCV